MKKTEKIKDPEQEDNCRKGERMSKKPFDSGSSSEKSLIREKSPLTFCLKKCPYYRENKCNPEILPEDLKC